MEKPTKKLSKIKIVRKNKAGKKIIKNLLMKILKGKKCINTPHDQQCWDADWDAYRDWDANN